MILQSGLSKYRNSKFIWNIIISWIWYVHCWCIKYLSSNQSQNIESLNILGGIQYIWISLFNHFEHETSNIFTTLILLHLRWVLLLYSQKNAAKIIILLYQQKNILVLKMGLWYCYIKYKGAFFINTTILGSPWGS